MAGGFVDFSVFVLWKEVRVSQVEVCPASVGEIEEAVSFINFFEDDKGVLFALWFHGFSDNGVDVDDDELCKDDSLLADKLLDSSPRESWLSLFPFFEVFVDEFPRSLVSKCFAFVEECEKECEHLVDYGETSGCFFCGVFFHDLVVDLLEF